MYDFDEIIPRKNTDSLKYDFAAERGKPEDVLSFWVADMDFKAPPAVINALTERAQHGIFGYTSGKDGYYGAVVNWFARRFHYLIRREWIAVTPGVVFGLSTAIRGLTQKGDAVLIQKPVYYPFSGTVLTNERKLINNPLVLKNGRYEMDLEDFERKIVELKVKLFFLCNPHNPVGRVWTREELTAMGKICVRYGVTVVSDEIHADFIYPGHKHTVFADICDAFSEITLTCTAPSKTFNLAGLQLSNIIIKNEVLRRGYLNEFRRTGYSQPNTMGVVATQAAYEHGEPWLEELLAYLAQNIARTTEFLHKNAPRLKVIQPEGTYLLWVDCRDLGLSTAALEDLIIHKAGLWLDGGTMFGDEGAGFQRINVACPWAVLEKGLHRLADAVREINQANP